MIESPNATITIQAPGDPEIKNLLQTLIARQEQTNALLERLAERGEPKEMLSHREAAAFLGVHVSTLQKLMSVEIPMYRIRGVKRYKRDDLQAWLDLHAEKKVSAPDPDAR
jgi:excisionase family DNA binding protein